MKKILFTLLGILCFMSLSAEIKCDAILTKNNFQIQCIINNIVDTLVTYIECGSTTGDIFIISTYDIRKVYKSNGEILDFSNIARPVETEYHPIKEEPAPSNKTSQNTDVPVKEIVKTVPSSSNNFSSKSDINLARVNTHNGLFVFNDCEPLSKYEVVGEVSINNLTAGERVLTSGQYQGLRDALIKAAKTANTQSEGVVLTLINGGIDKAYIIKFKNSEDDHSLARVQRIRGTYIFCDCEPINNYEYLGDLKGKFTFNPQYTVLRDDILRKCLKKYKDANGVILHFVLGGKDTAEAIKL